MGEMIRLTTADGRGLDAYQATPEGPARGGVVIMQEIFGLTAHIRRVVDQYAGQGFLTIAPSLFDQIEPGIVLEYSEVEKGRDFMMTLDRDKLVADMTAAANAVRPAGKVAAIGYCWGGAMADLAACRVGVDAAVSYYGRATVNWLDEQPQCPVLYHYGAQDPLIPPELVEQITAGRPGQQSYIYADAGHGFNCDEREDYRPESAALAFKRTLDFLEDQL